MTRFLVRLVRGLVAGALATWVMGKVTALLYEREDPDAREREDALRHGRTAYEVAAERGASLAGQDLTREKRARVGKLLSWSLGILAGVVYAFGIGGKRRRLWSGPAFGAGMFLTMDEGMNTALGLTPSPRAFPWQTHARGLAGHLVYGAVADAALRATEPLARRLEGQEDEEAESGGEAPAEAASTAAASNAEAPFEVEREVEIVVTREEVRAIRRESLPAWEEEEARAAEREEAPEGERESPTEERHEEASRARVKEDVDA